MASTVAWALSSLSAAEQCEIIAHARGQEGRLLLWVVGARESMEGELVRNGHFAEPLLQLCPPALIRGGLELVLIGPEMNEWALELPPPGSSSDPPVARTAAHRSPIIVRALSGTMHGAADVGQERPNAIVLFNSGIGTLLWPLVEAWLPSVASMLLLDVPILCTCFNEREAEGCVLVVLSPTRPGPAHPPTLAPYVVAVAVAGVVAPGK